MVIISSACVEVSLAGGTKLVQRLRVHQLWNISHWWYHMRIIPKLTHLIMKHTILSVILLSLLYHVLLFNRFVYHINIYTTYIQSTKMKFAPLSTTDNYFRCCRAFLKFTKDKKKTLNTERGNLVISSNQCYLSLFSVSLK